MNLYTLYSESHKILYDNYFIPTCPKEFTLHSMVADQLCQSGSYYESGWSDICRQKVRMFKDACKANMGSFFVWSDVDVIFFGPCKDALLEELGNYDIACQDDFTGCCSGFFIVRANDRTLNLFSKMLDDYQLEDQYSLNIHLNCVSHKRLSHRFHNYGQTRGRVWNGEPFEVDKNILMHHANWIVGVAGKIRLLNYVRQCVTDRTIPLI